MPRDVEMQNAPTVVADDKKAVTEGDCWHGEEVHRRNGFSMVAQECKPAFRVPTSSSWLNLVERWLRELTEKAIRRGSFVSVPDLKQAIEAFMQA